MRGFRYIRGIVGDVANASSVDLFAHYRFEADYPKYDFDLGAMRGQEFVDWAMSVINGPVEAVLIGDARKIDVPLGYLKDTGDFELVGHGTQGILPDGQPDWGEGREMHIWSMLRDYDMAIDELRSKIRAVGDNDIAKQIIATGAQVTGSDPLFFKMEMLIWRVNTNDLDSLGPMARDFFVGHQQRRMYKILKKSLVTRQRNKRREAAKKGWRRRKIGTRIQKALEKMSRVEQRKIENQMYHALLAIVQKELTAKATRKKRTKQTRALTTKIELLMYEQFEKLSKKGRK